MKKTEKEAKIIKSLKDTTGNYRYAAFLRGINVGGNVLVKMSDLKKVFEKMGYLNVKTVLASGNVGFEMKKEEKCVVIEKKIEKELVAQYKRPISVLVRSVEDLQKIVKMDPFKKIDVQKSTRLYVTFLGNDTESGPAKSKNNIKIPYVTPGKEFQILKVTASEIFSVLEVKEATRTPDLMNIVEKEYGKNVTTRNWNTVLKML